MPVVGYRNFVGQPTDSDQADAEAAATLIDQYTGTSDIGGLTIGQRNVTVTCVYGIVRLPMPMTGQDFASASATYDGDTLDLDGWSLEDSRTIRLPDDDRESIVRFVFSGRMGYGEGDPGLDQASQIIIGNLQAARVSVGRPVRADSRLGRTHDIFAGAQQILDAYRWI